MTTSTDVARRQLAGQSSSWSISVYLNVLREYQRKPDSYNRDLTIAMLLDTLTHFDSAEFTACCCLLQQEQLSDPAIVSLLGLQDLLERGQFSTFWETWNTERGQFGEVGTFEQRIRLAMIRALSNTFQSLDMSLTVRTLGLKDEASVLALSKEVKKVGNNAVFAENQFNTPAPPPAPRLLSSRDLATLVI